MAPVAHKDKLFSIKETLFAIIGKYSRDKESVDITASMTCYVN